MSEDRKDHSEWLKPEAYERKPYPPLSDAEFAAAMRELREQAERERARPSRPSAPRPS